MSKNKGSTKIDNLKLFKSSFYTFYLKNKSNKNIVIWKEFSLEWIILIE